MEPESAPQTALSAEEACCQSVQPGLVLEHHVNARADTHRVILTLPARGYLQSQGGRLRGIRRGERREILGNAQRGVIVKQCFKRTHSAALGQRRADEIGGIADTMYELGITPNCDDRVSATNP